MSKRGKGASGRLAAREGEKILVVDDDSRVLDLLQITLSGRGFDVVTANNGDEAVRRVSGSNPDLVVLDDELPRRSGLEVLESLRGSPAFEHLPVILISSNASSEAKLKGLRNGADDYIAKPFSPRELILRIRRILDRVHESENLTRRVSALERKLSQGERALEESRTEMRSRLFRMGSIVRVLQELGQSDAPDELVTKFVTVAVGYLNLGVTALFLRDEDGRISLRAGRGWTREPAEGLAFAPDGVLAELVGQNDRLLSLAPLSARRETRAEVAPLEAAGIAYLFPVHVDGELVGAIAHGPPESPSDQNLDLIAGIARSVSVAMSKHYAIADMQRSLLETSSSLIRRLESRHTGMAGHSDRVSRLAVALAQRIGLDTSQVDAIRLGGQLHDLGLIEIYEMLDEPREIGDVEREHLAEAPLRAAATLSDTGPLNAVAEIVRCHHEHWDGTGYPLGFGEESIPIGARIVALANAFDALTHERPHRPAYEVDTALTILSDDAGRVFDPSLVRAFVEMIETGTVAVA